MNRFFQTSSHSSKRSRRKRSEINLHVKERKEKKMTCNFVSSFNGLFVSSYELSTEGRRGRMRTKAVAGIVFMMLFLVVVSPIGVSVVVMDFESESGDFILMMRRFPHVCLLWFSLICLFMRFDVGIRLQISV